MDNWRDYFFFISKVNKRCVFTVLFEVNSQNIYSLIFIIQKPISKLFIKLCGFLHLSVGLFLPTPKHLSM